MKKYSSAMVAICLGGLALALLGLFLTETKSIHASQPQAPTIMPDLVIDAQAHDETTLADSVITYTIFYTNNLPAQDLSDVVIVSTLSKNNTIPPPTSAILSYPRPALRLAAALTMALLWNGK